MSEHPAELGAQSTPAIISYVILALFALSALGVFLIIFTRVEVNPLMAGVLGTVLGSTGTGYAAVQGFWIGNSSSSKVAQSDLAASNKAANSALAQLAGSGPPPPADPAGLPPAEPLKEST